MQPIQRPLTPSLISSMSGIDNHQVHFQGPATRTGVEPANKHEKRRPSSYATLLEAPLSSIVSNVPDRADVTSSAILGYN